VKALYDRLREDLEDEDTWRVLADRLEERGDPRAALIRLDLATRRARQLQDAETARALARERSRLAREAGVPRGSWQQGHWPIVFGGFPIGVSIPGAPHIIGRRPDTPEEPWSTVLDRHPLACVLAIEDRRIASHAARIAAVGERIRVLRIKVLARRWPDDWPGLPPMPALHTLRVVPAEPDRHVASKVLRRAMELPFVRGLRFLDLAGSIPLGLAHPSLLRAHFVGLQGLDLAHTQAMDWTLGRIRTLLPSLRRLDLAGHALGPEGVALLADHAPQLEWLNLSGGPMSEDSARVLASGRFVQLRFVGLGGTSIGPVGRRALLDAPWASAIAGLNPLQREVMREDVSR